MSGMIAHEDEMDRRIRLGLDLLETGRLYTAGRLAFSVVEHRAAQKPRLKLKLYPAWFAESMAHMRTLEGPR